MLAFGLAACGTDGVAPNAIASTDASAALTGGGPAANAGTPLPTAVSNDFHLSFDGIDDRVLVPWDASFPTEVFTVSASVRIAAPPPRRAAIIARGEDDDSFNLSWQLYVIPDGTLEAMLEASNEDNYCYPKNNCVPFGTCESGDLFVADGAWHQVALTRDQSGTLVFYIDGQERARCEGTGNPSSNNRQFLSFGATHGAIGPLPKGGMEPPIWFFPGEIDDLAMWNTSLTATEIEALHQDGIDQASPGLVGFWNLDEGQGQEVNDLSPALNHGYLGADPAADSADPVWKSPGPPPPTPTPTPTKQPPPGDTDGDGCTDSQENGPSETVGGQRDYLSFWDFYDTPAGSPPGRDRRVNIVDIGALVLRFGTVSGPLPTKEEWLAAALTPPSDLTGYHAAFDRGGPIPGEDLWDLLPPDGAINIIDIGAMVIQFGHTCA